MWILAVDSASVSKQFKKECVGNAYSVIMGSITEWVVFGFWMTVSSLGSGKRLWVLFHLRENNRVPFKWFWINDLPWHLLRLQFYLVYNFWPGVEKFQSKSSGQIKQCSKAAVFAWEFAHTGGAWRLIIHRHSPLILVSLRFAGFPQSYPPQKLPFLGLPCNLSFQSGTFLRVNGGALLIIMVRPQVWTGIILDKTALNGQLHFSHFTEEV